MTIAASHPELRALLEAELACCRRLAPILDAERAAAASYDHAALLACLREREAVQVEWHDVAGRRRKALQALGVPPATLFARDTSLATLAADVRRTGEEIRRAQRVNAGLVAAALAHVTDLLTVMRRALPDHRYDGRAALTSGTPMVSGGSWSA